MLVNAFRLNSNVSLSSMACEARVGTCCVSLRVCSRRSSLAALGHLVRQAVNSPVCIVTTLSSMSQPCKGLSELQCGQNNANREAALVLLISRSQWQIRLPRDTFYGSSKRALRVKRCRAAPADDEYVSMWVPLVLLDLPAEPVVESSDAANMPLTIMYWGWSLRFGGNTARSRGFAWPHTIVCATAIASRSSRQCGRARGVEAEAVRYSRWCTVAGY